MDVLFVLAVIAAPWVLGFCALAAIVAAANR